MATRPSLAAWPFTSPYALARTRRQVRMTQLCGNFAVTVRRVFMVNRTAITQTEMVRLPGCGAVGNSSQGGVTH